MPEITHILDEARRIAGQPVGDRTEGKQGSEAEDVLVRLAEAAGLDYVEALRLMSAVQWHHWGNGWAAGYEGRLERDSRD
jgi:hypothetical protein